MVLAVLKLTSEANFTVQHKLTSEAEELLILLPLFYCWGEQSVPLCLPSLFEGLSMRFASSCSLRSVTSRRVNESSVVL